jgi:hypothetical protein
VAAFGTASARVRHALIPQLTPNQSQRVIAGSSLAVSALSVHGLSKGKMRFQSVFMLVTVQPRRGASSSALSRRPIDDCRS